MKRGNKALLTMFLVGSAHSLGHMSVAGIQALKDPDVIAGGTLASLMAGLLAYQL